MSKQLDWLKTNALFSCVGGCAEEVSRNAEDLRICQDGPVCEDCYDYETGEDWGALPPFNPFAEYERILSDAKAIRQIAAVEKARKEIADDGDS